MPVPQHQIPNYLVQSILATIFCCLPLGIVAIVYAAQVNGKIASGDIQGAIDASAQAKKWSLISFFVSLAFGVIYLVCMALGLAGGAAAAATGM